MTIILLLLILLLLIVSEGKKFSRETPFQRKLRENEYSIYSLYSDEKNGKSGVVDSEKEQLYEAYNLLHSLAQVICFVINVLCVSITNNYIQLFLFQKKDFHKPFDAPAVICVGHQTSGKSALIEAIMGFQFNQVYFIIFLNFSVVYFY
jgi:GTPase